MVKGSINQTPTRILTGDEYFTTRYSPYLLRRYQPSYFNLIFIIKKVIYRYSCASDMTIIMNALPVEDPAMRGSVGDAKGGHLLKALQIVKNLLFSSQYICTSKSVKTLTRGV